MTSVGRRAVSLLLVSRRSQCCWGRASHNMAAKVVAADEARRFIREAMEAVGTCREHATALADLLVEADCRGHYSHGLNRLGLYVGDVQNGMCASNSRPRVLKESPSTAWVDGNNSLGAVVGNFCMQLAMDKARTTGVGWVSAKGSNHFGIAGWYSMMAAKQDPQLRHMIFEGGGWAGTESTQLREAMGSCLKVRSSGLGPGGPVALNHCAESCDGMSFTNTSPLLSPTRSKSAALGTNPISVAAPANDGDSFVLDMATTAVAVGKIEMQMRKNEPIPEGWAQGPDGRPTTDAEQAFDTGCLMPLGGSEETSGYKGYGLALAVEVFSAILSGSLYGPNVRQWKTTGSSKVADLGHCFVAVDPGCFAPGFQDRMSDILQHLRSMEPIDPSKPVLTHGDPERIHMKLVDEQGGIPYHENQIKASVELAKSLKIEPMKMK